MWAYAVYNDKFEWVEVWSKKPIFDEESSSWIGAGYLTSWCFPEVSLELIREVKERGPLVVSVNIEFSFIASLHDLKIISINCPDFI